MCKRCGWVSDDPVYQEYHDKEWGVPVYNDRDLLEKLILDGAQAGLSWITILKRRDSYRIAYDQFDPSIMADWSDEKLEELLQNPGIIRNRLKVQSARKNARAYLKLMDQGGFSSFLWSFVGGSPKINNWTNLSEVPAETEESKAMSKALKKRGFTFVGPTICYAFMQAVGMVNDHTIDCFRYRQLV